MSDDSREVISNVLNWDEELQTFFAVQGDEGPRCVGATDATHTVHQPSRFDVALNSESD
jgi:hypothetical protein